MKNNNEQFENFIRDFDSIRMTTDEKNEMTHNLELFVRNYVPTPSPYYIYTSFFKKTLAFALIAVLFVAGSKPAAAKALPGEFLYNVKIFHEKIEAATITEPKKKVNFEIKLTEKRIREAVKLAETKKLDTGKQEKLAQDIKKHVNNISAEIKEIKTENPEQALALNSELKTTLKVNSQALKKVTRKKKHHKKAKKENNNLIQKPTKKITKKITNPVENNQDALEKDTINNTDILSADNSKIDSVEYVATNIDDALETPEKDPHQDETETLERTETETEVSEQVEIKIEISKDEITDTDIVTDSFAYVILDSIDTDIKKTEVADTLIKKEIIKDEIDTPQEIKTISESPVDSLATKDIQETITDIKTPDGNISLKLPLENNKTSEENPILDENIFLEEKNSIEQKNAANIDAEIPKVKPLVQGEKSIEPTAQETSVNQTSLEHTQDLKDDVISMERILTAEDTLKKLLQELGKIRSDEKTESIRILIENNQLGQAYIDIQKEIEILSELKLQHNLASELGINIEIEHPENPTADISTETHE